MSEKECELFKTIDQDNNNEVDFAEFCAFYTNPSFADKERTAETFANDGTVHSA